MTQEQQERVLNNDGLVFTCYTRELHHGWSTRFWREDLMQEGRFGLCKAAVTYNENSGQAFTTYAYVCIKNEMLQALRHLKGDVEKCYLDDIVGYGNDGDTQCLNDVLGVIDSYEDTDEIRFFKTMCKICTEEEKRVIELILDGYSGKELRDKLENRRTRQAVSYWYRKFINRCKLMWQLSKTFKEFPKENQYLDDAFYLNDLKRLWCMLDKSKFKRSSNLLKKQYRGVNDVG